MATPPLDICALPLAGMNLVEAAAGTGKTRTIAALYLRTVLQTEIQVRNILVVTYTHAATRELRERVRDLLLQAVGVFQHGDAGEDALLNHLAAIHPDSELAVKRLRRAIADFDEAAIFTIHGFCQRVLAENAFEGAQPFESELLTDERQFVGEVVDDFWRRNIYPANVLWVDWLQANGVDRPETLLNGLANVTGKPYLHIAPLPEPKPPKILEDELQSCFQKLADDWSAQRDSVEKILLEDDRLNRNRYRVSSVAVWITQMDQLLKRSRPDFMALREFTRFDRFQASVISDRRSVKKGHAPPTHPFFESCDDFAECLENLEAIYQQRYRIFQRELYQYVVIELPLRKAERGALGYDDLLTRLQTALRSPHSGSLVEKLRSDYQVALIDEFQDTDPVQYDIFRKIYHGSDCPVFLVGDPKQAIYSFRGADVFTYLYARQDATKQFSLEQNWRSVPQLVHAVNLLFERRADLPAFLLDEIDFSPAQPAPKQLPELTESGLAAPALTIWPLSREDDDNKPIAKHRAGSLCVAATTTEITRLLALPAKIGEEPLHRSDIAVLVRTHSQARIVETAMREAGIASVRHSQESVYQTHEAVELERVLIAILEPNREARVRAALLTDFWGMDAASLQSFSSLELAWDARLAGFHHYHELWRTHGFMRMFREWTAVEGVYPRLLDFEDGDRRLTNLLQLAELIHGQERHCAGLNNLVTWFSEAMTRPPVRDDPSLLRLESDEDRVQIVTVHGSKGLQYPVVFLPFSWSGGLQVAGSERCIFHDISQGNAATVDFGSVDFEQHLAQACREELAENLRLFYVALTRARCRCYLAWGAVNDAATSALAWLLHRSLDVVQDDFITALQTRFRAITDPEIFDTLERLAERSEGAIQVIEPSFEPNGLTTSDAVSKRPMAAREVDRKIDQTWRLTSFSALSTGYNTELPDYDHAQQRVLYDGERPDVFTFPRGARAGTCLHQVFEELDFSSPDADHRNAVIERVLKTHGYEAKWQDVVAQLVDRVLHVPLDPHGKLRLVDIQQSQRVDEMEFYYPFAAHDPQALKSAIQASSDDAHIKSAIQQIELGSTAGFMHGFIDLVFEAAGRYYLVDYKSNFLGMNQDDYRPGLLKEVMEREQYVLQYLIYTVALHRYLKHRIPDYHYEEHFGGVYYLFLRGMDPALDNQCGVYYDRPGQALIGPLERLLGSVI